jgi:hypothetical protein
VTPTEGEATMLEALPELDEESVVVQMLRAYNWTPSLGQKIAQEP